MATGGEQIFISYRRSDGAGHARSLFERLRNDYGPDAVFFDTERIDAGADFPKRLQEAVAAARIVIAVMGPDWLDEIKRRARKRKEMDFVRVELTQALAPRPSGDPCLVVHALFGGASNLTSDSLGPSLQTDLGALVTKNSVELQASSWEAGYAKLRNVIDPIWQTRAGGTSDYAALSAETAKKLRTILARPELNGLATHWDLDESAGQFARPVSDMLTDLSGAIIKFAGSWQTTPSADTLDRVIPGLVELALETLRLGVDPVAARAWHLTGTPAPLRTVGIALLVRSIAVGESLVVEDFDTSDVDFRPARSYAMKTALDRGAAARHRQQVATGLWPHAFATPKVGEMNEQAERQLAIRIKSKTLRDKLSFIVTAPMSDASYRSDLTNLAKDFNAVGLGRVPSPETNVLRESEDELVNAFCLCLEEINKLP